MARSPMASHEEFTNFACACRISIDVFGDVFWKVCIDHIPADKLKRRIQAFLRPLPYNQYQTFHHELNNLCNLGHDIKRTDCDVSVLYAIVRNLCGLSPPSKGWGKCITRCAKYWTMTDGLESLRVARNDLFAHAKLSKMTKIDYDNFVNRFKAILGKLDVQIGGTFSQCLSTIVTDSLNPATNALFKRYADQLLEEKKNKTQLQELVKQMEARFNIFVTAVTSYFNSKRDRSYEENEKWKKSSKDQVPMPDARFQQIFETFVTETRRDFKESKRPVPIADSVLTDIQQASSIAEFVTLEERLKAPEEFKVLTQNLAAVGGLNVKEEVKGCLTKLMTNELMSRFNMKGMNGKVAFGETAVCKVVLSSVQLSKSAATEVELRKAVATCLKNAPDRRGGGGRKEEKK